MPPLSGPLRLAPRFIDLDDPLVGAVQMMPVRGGFAGKELALRELTPRRPAGTLGHSVVKRGVDVG